jgi:hypothetical protein
MALDIYFKEDIAQAILAGLVLVLQTDGGRNTEYLRGALSAYQHQAHVVGADWLGLLAKARSGLSDGGLAHLFDMIDLIEG